MSIFSEGMATEWYFDQDFFFLFEIPTEKIKHLLPTSIAPVELRPGVSVISYGLHHFLAGNLDGALEKAFWEVNANIMVQPSFKYDMPMPRFAFYVLYVSSSYEEFLYHAYNNDKMPVYKPFSMQVTATDTEILAKDDYGTITFLKSTIENPKFSHEKIYGQAYTQHQSSIYCIPFAWEGLMFETQQKNTHCKLFNHPSIAEINLDLCEEHCYMQMLSPKNQKGILTYGKPFKVHN